MLVTCPAAGGGAFEKALLRGRQFGKLQFMKRFRSRSQSVAACLSGCTNGIDSRLDGENESADSGRKSDKLLLATDRYRPVTDLGVLPVWRIL